MIYGAATLSVFGLAGLSRFLVGKTANSILIAATTLFIGWVWTVGTQMLVPRNQPTLSYAYLDVLSISAILYVNLVYGPKLWSICLWLTFLVQLLIHLEFVPSMIFAPNGVAYMWWLNSIFVVQLAIVTLQSIRLLVGKYSHARVDRHS